MLTKKWSVVAIIILLSSGLTMADPPAVHPATQEPLVIPCLRGTPDAIDGDLSDWNLAAMTPAVLDVAEQLYTGQASWSNPEDCSGQFYLLWDDEKIYIAAVVKDDKLSMNKSGGDIWNADCIEVFFSTTDAVGAHSATTHYQYGFNARNQRWNWCNMDGTGATEPGYLQVASSETPEGYICEVSIEHSRMLSLDFGAGNVIGFHPVIDDTDDGDREIQMTWTSREAHDQSLGFGHVTLSSERAVGATVSSGPRPARGAVRVPIDTTLSWNAGKFAASHDIYLGTAYDAVNEATRDNPMGVLVSQGQAAAEFHPADLAYGATYYWRVDEVNAPPDSTIYKGNVWSFMVQSQTAWKPFPPDGMKHVEPDQDLSWDIGMGVLFHTLYIGQNFEQVNSAPAGGFMMTQPAYDPGTLTLDTTYYWRVDEFAFPGNKTFKGPVWSFTTRGEGGGLKAEYFRGVELSGNPLLSRVEGTIDHQWGSEAIAGGLTDLVSARWRTNLEVPFTETYRLTTTSDDGVRLWLDGRLIIDNWTDHSATDNTATVDLVAGQYYLVQMEWYDSSGGAVAQLFWRSDTLPHQIIPQGWLRLPLNATSPSPEHLDPHAYQTPILTWNGGDGATGHDVYFGEAAEAVAGADATTTGIYRGRQAANATSFDPGPLDWGKTYYWRVDEVNPNGVLTGALWCFTTATFIPVEDFENYTDDEGNRIYETWIDGWTNNTGSQVGYSQAPFAERKIVHSGRQSMPMDYNGVNSPFYSEAEQTFSSVQNWTVNGVDTLTLFMRGAAKNDAGKLYAAIEDSTGKVAAVSSDASLSSTVWVEVSFPLSQFTGVNLSRVKVLYLGVGNRSAPAKGGAGRLYIDDIRVTKTP